jgi:hypothetical protein
MSSRFLLDGDEDSEGEINKTQDTLYLAMKAALNKGWLTRNRADGYLKPSEEYISQTDRRVKRKKIQIWSIFSQEMKTKRINLS